MMIPLILASIITVSPGQSIQAAVNVANSGDSIVVQPGTYTGDVSIGRLHNVALSGSPCTVPSIPVGVAQGQHITCSTKIAGKVYAAPATGPDHDIVQDFEITGGIDLQSAGHSPYATDMVFRRLNMGGQFLSKDYPSRILVEDVEWSKPLGAVNVMHVFGNDWKLRRLRMVAANTGGHFVLSSSVGASANAYSVEVDNGWFDRGTSGCTLIVDGDACFQGYNSRYFIHDSYFKSWSDDTSVYGGAGNARRTNTGQRPSALRFVNNTVIGKKVGGACVYSVGDKLNRGVELTTSAIVDEFTVQNNIFECFGNTTDARSGAVRLVGCISNLSVTNNDFWQNQRDIANEAGCSGSALVGNINADPLLDPVTLLPAANSPVCARGIGAGKCSGPQPSPSPSPQPSPSPSASPSPQPSPSPAPSPSPSPVPSPSPSPVPSPSPSPQPSPSPSPSPTSFDCLMHCVLSLTWSCTCNQ